MLDTGNISFAYVLDLANSVNGVLDCFDHLDFDMRICLVFSVLCFVFIMKGSGFALARKNGAAGCFMTNQLFSACKPPALR
jgi:hypothetical protein